MPVDLHRKLPALFRCHPPHMPADGGPHVQALPSHQLRPPGDVGVLAISEKIGVEKLSCNRNVVDHGAAIQCCCPRRSKHEFRPVVLPGIAGPSAAIEMTKLRTKI